MWFNFLKSFRFVIILGLILTCQLAFLPGLDYRLAFLNLPLLWVIWFCFDLNQAKIIKLIIIGSAIDLVALNFSFQLWSLLVVVLIGGLLSRQLTNATQDFFYRILGFFLIQIYYLVNLFLAWFFGHWQNVSALGIYLNWSTWIYFTILNYTVYELTFLYKHWRKTL